MSLTSMHYIKSFRNLAQKVNLCLGNQNFSPVFSSNFKPFLKSDSTSLVIIAEKKSIASELGFPEPPKKPVNPYIRYIAEENKRLPGLMGKEKLMKISENWRSLGESIKSKYTNEFNNESAIYKQEKINYTASLTPDQLDKIKTLEAKKRFEKEESRLKKKKRLDSDLLEKPKFPGNSFSLFVWSIKNELGALPKNTTVMEFARNKWLELPQVQRDSFGKEAKKKLLPYKEELRNWEIKMITQGRDDLVRQLTLNASKKRRQ